MEQATHIPVKGISIYNFKNMINKPSTSVSQSGPTTATVGQMAQMSLNVTKTLYNV